MHTYASLHLSQKINFEETKVSFANIFRPWIMDEGTLRSTVSDVLI
jgi:hypothetical protein